MGFAARWSTLVAIGLIAVSASAGDLDPPGSPTSTAPIEARTAINQTNTPGDASSEFIVDRPGSYYLTENLRFGIFGEAKNGILIEASDVTIDLNGFTLDGGTRALVPLEAERQIITIETSLTGIQASGFPENLTIVNGTVRDWGDEGINFEGVSNVRIEGVQVSGSGLSGLRVGSNCEILDSRFTDNDGAGILGSSVTIMRCVLENNGGSGATVSTSSLVADCVIRNNGGRGLSVRSRTLVRDCTVSNNGEEGIHQEGSGTIISGCTVVQNGSHGIEASDTLISGNICQSNGWNLGGDGAGIDVSFNGHCVIRDNVCAYNDVGIRWGTTLNNTVVRNNCHDNDVLAYSGDDTGNRIGGFNNYGSAWTNFSGF